MEQGFIDSMFKCKDGTELEITNWGDDVELEITEFGEYYSIKIPMKEFTRMLYEVKIINCIKGTY